MAATSTETGRTFAGKAGVPKEIRDRIQNHALRERQLQELRLPALFLTLQRKRKDDARCRKQPDMPINPPC